MFSKGQLIFAILFLVSFVISISLAYKRDKNSNSVFFKGTYKILIFILFVFFLLFGFVKFKHLIFP